MRAEHFMGLSILQKHVSRFFKVNLEKNELAREERALKSFFSKKAAELGESVFKHRDIIVTVESDESCRLDTAALRRDHPDLVKKYEKQGESEKITVKKVGDKAE
jgi:predicted phage-related endonuclease